MQRQVGGQKSAKYMCRVDQKVTPKYCTHNFVKYWPIFQFFYCYNLQKICNAAVIKYTYRHTL